MNRILYISSEAFPLIKTGGLADVAGSLPVALKQHAQDICLCLPAYPEVISKLKRYDVRAETRYYNQTVRILQSTLPGSDVTLWLVDCPSLFMRPGGPYSDAHGHVWHDNALRFALFCRAAVDIARDQLQLDWAADIVHCNDWQTGLVPALLEQHTDRPSSVFTIHNLAYQGLFDQQAFYDLNLPTDLWHFSALEFYGQLSFIKGGLVFADKLTTVSPSYAEEICLPEFGYGLDGLLRYRKDDLLGILNGIDHRHWDPQTDHHLPHNYSNRNLDNKALNKLALQKKLGLKQDAEIPMLGMVSRLVEQKGLEIILHCLPMLQHQPLQLVILGTGELHYEMQLAEFAQQHPDIASVTIGYNEALAHQIEAASDLYLMPSSFEPCGLNQLYSLRYGTLPIVNAVGGLADTVVHASEKNRQRKTANGFVLENYSSAALLDAIEQACALFPQKKLWQQLQVNAMKCDHSWDNRAQHYITLYDSLLCEKST